MPPDAPRESRLWLYPAMVVGLLALQIALCAVAVVLSQRQGTAAAVQENYHQRALQWRDGRLPDHVAPRLNVGEARGVAGGRTLTLTIEDAGGRPWPVTEVRIRSSADAPDAPARRMTRAASGIYVLDVPLGEVSSATFQFVIAARGRKATWEVARTFAD